MNGAAAVVEFIEAFEALNVPYLLAGSFSSNYYGITRSTADADFVIQRSPELLREVLKSVGPDFKRDPQITFESITGTIRHMIRIRDAAFKIEIFELSSDPHDRMRFDRRIELYSSDLEHTVFMPTPEDVIVMKLRWARSKDRDDVAAVIGVQGDTLDWNYIRHWTDQHGTTTLLEEIQQSIPPLD